MDCIEHEGKYNLCDVTLTITWENKPEPHAYDKTMETIHLTWTIMDGEDGAINSSRRFLRTLRNLRTEVVGFGKPEKNPNMKPSSWINQMLGINWSYLSCRPKKSDLINRPTWHYVIREPDRHQTDFSGHKLHRLDRSILRYVHLTRRFYTETYELKCIDSVERQV
jgi:hypothetical protein